MINQQQTFPALKKTQKQILSGIFVAVNLLFLVSCDYYKNKHYMTNTYFSTLYARDLVSQAEYIGAEPQNYMNVNIKDYKTVTKYKDFNFQFPFLVKTDFSLSTTPAWGRGFVLTDFYQDESMQCYLFSYSMDELIKMREVTGPGWNDPIYIIQKDGISVISEAEYEKLKPTFKPHSYNPNLCRPKPANREENNENK